MRLTSSEDEDNDEDDDEDEREEGLRSTGRADSDSDLSIYKVAMCTAHRGHTEVIDPKIPCDKHLLQILAIRQLDHIPLS